MYIGKQNMRINEQRLFSSPRKACKQRIFETALQWACAEGCVCAFRCQHRGTWYFYIVLLDHRHSLNTHQLRRWQCYTLVNSLLDTNPVQQSSFDATKAQRYVPKPPPEQGRTPNCSWWIRQQCISVSPAVAAAPPAVPARSRKWESAKQAGTWET